MDAAASPIIESNINGVYGLFLQVENSSFESPTRHRSTYIKYTKFPDFELQSKALWPDKTLTNQPRQRRVVTLDDIPVVTSRSLRKDLLNTMSTSLTKRKIVTIEEDDENSLHPKFSKDVKKTNNVKTSNRAVESQYKNENQYSQRTTSRLSNTSSNLSKENKVSAKNAKPATLSYIKKNLSAPKEVYRNKISNSSPPAAASKSRNLKEKEQVKCRNYNIPTKISISKNIVTPRESEKEVTVVKNKFSDSVKSNYSYKKSVERQQLSKIANQSPKKTAMFLRELNKSKPVNVIRVPLDIKYQSDPIEFEDLQTSVYPCVQEIKNVDNSTEIEKDFYLKDITIGTDSLKHTKDKVIQVESEDNIACINSPNMLSELTNFDRLAIPNVTLSKDKNESKEEIVSFHSKSLPNLQVPSLKVNSHIDEEVQNSAYVNKTSYIIGHATVTCTTRQKINFHLVGNNSEKVSNRSPSPLAYPLNVVSIFENEVKKKRKNPFEQCSKSNIAYTNCLNELQSLNCSYVLNSSKLVKPSDIISTIRVNNGLLKNDYICEQFQRELNFIDSFFESLQYLENCSLSEKCFSDSKVKNLINPEYGARNTEYGSILSNLENGANVVDTETMASKSLCLLNLLIRDEQRRAKNLLFVLKMREDALKDFTKSQILWLENKKKQDNTDVSTLKKKQRGALLKLQHECGEMQRMRKALLTQSEKRKVALMKTKKNIELKLKNNVAVDQIIIGKKKLKRNTPDRNIAPIKCFELSSSGCDESSPSKTKLENQLPTSMTNINSVKSAEKCVQTGDSILDTSLLEKSTDTAAENFVVVDGGYLNILFHNLSFPQIFSSGKQYEVNEEALRNILHTSDTQNHFTERDVLARFMDQVKNPDLDSSTPSTARSLVEELDQYYKGFVLDDKSPIESPVRESNENYEVKESLVDTKMLQCDSHSLQSASTMTSDSTDTVLESADLFFMQRSCVCELSEDTDTNQDLAIGVLQAGPLPVPVGAAASSDPQPADVSNWVITKTSIPEDSVSSHSNAPSGTSISSVASPAQSEAEELRRQQLAIEREIKALEQQQCQLLVVREIPDKPPPPYTPPNETRSARPPRIYVTDESTEEKIQKYIQDPNTDSCDPTDDFDTFVKDFCIEALNRQKLDQSEFPWDPCNLLPQKVPDDTETLMKKTSTQISEILTGVPPTLVKGVGARRSDHIDDILFAEWRRCEPEWTSLQTDEALVKNQIFESIFQKILTETIDEYKRTVVCD